MPLNLLSSYFKIQLTTNTKKNDFFHTTIFIILLKSNPKDCQALDKKPTLLYSKFYSNGLLLVDITITKNYQRFYSEEEVLTRFSSFLMSTPATHFRILGLLKFFFVEDFSTFLTLLYFRNLFFVGGTK
jgi:hypothetical protein